MTLFIVRRTLIGLSTVVMLSVISFVIIQLPPGDYLDAYAGELQETQTSNLLDREGMDALRAFYGLDRPLYVQYLKWVANMSRGSFGFSFERNQDVWDAISEELLMTVVLASSTVLFTWAMAIPIGIYSAVRQHSIGDYTFTFIGFIGLAVPDFLLALTLMYFAFQYFDLNIGGLFSVDYLDAPWSAARAVDLLSHLWIPAIVLGTSGTAALIRIMRANVLDELNKPYVSTARAKGLGEMRLVLKYPVRVALNPFISTVGYVLPYLMSGSVIVSLVLSLPTIGPVLLKSLQSQDMYLAGTIILLLGMLTVLGTLLSDLLLVITDPRIRIDS